MVPDELQLGERHVSAWIAMPFHEPEVVDISVRFPLSLDRFEEALKDSLIRLLDYAEELYPTTPQLDDHYASFIAVPLWVAMTEREVLVIDTRPIGGTAYAVERLTVTSVADRGPFEMTGLSSLSWAEWCKFGAQEPPRFGLILLPTD